MQTKLTDKCYLDFIKWYDSQDYRVDWSSLQLEHKFGVYVTFFSTVKINLFIYPWISYYEPIILTPMFTYSSFMRCNDIDSAFILGIEEANKMYNETIS